MNGFLVNGGAKNSTSKFEAIKIESKKKKKQCHSCWHEWILKLFLSFVVLKTLFYPCAGSICLDSIAKKNKNLHIKCFASHLSHSSAFFVVVVWFVVFFSSINSKPIPNMFTIARECFFPHQIIQTLQNLLSNERKQCRGEKKRFAAAIKPKLNCHASHYFFHFSFQFEC